MTAAKPAAVRTTARSCMKDMLLIFFAHRCFQTHTQRKSVNIILKGFIFKVLRNWISGLNFISSLLCPHYDFEKDRKPDLKKMMSKTSGIAIALDNCCAIEIIDETYKIISSKDSANAYKVFWSKGKYYQTLISKEKKFLPLSDLLKK